MNKVEMNHCRIVRESLTGERETNEQTLASLAILAERLERLKRFGNSFSDVTFSAAVRKLARKKNAVAVG